MAKKPTSIDAAKIADVIAVLEQILGQQPDQQAQPPQAQEPAMQTPQDVQVQDQELAMGSPQEAQVPEPEPDDQYAGPSEDDIVGDTRKVKAMFLAQDFDGSSVPIGEAWQDEDGKLYGSGMMAIMLYEPIMKQRYTSMSIGLDVSPLTVIAKRLSRGSFVKAWFTGDDDEA